MARERFPHTLYYFQARTNNRFGAGYSGVIEPRSTPMTQLQYEKYAKRQLNHYRKLDSVVEITITEFKKGPTRTEKIKHKPQRIVHMHPGNNAGFAERGGHLGVRGDE